MAMQDIRNRYGVPAKRGARVRYTGGTRIDEGTIVGTHKQYVRIRMDGDQHAGTYHPTWELEYL